MKQSILAIGLMSGTSCDGIDASLVRITGDDASLLVEELGFLTVAYEDAVRDRLLVLAKGSEGGSRELCLMDGLLGSLFADAALAVCAQAGVEPSRIGLIGTHGHTFHHLPNPVEYLGHQVRSTLQLGQSCFLSEHFSCPVVSDFRPRDLAAGGQGAPLVPYTEYLLYRQEGKGIGLLNVGGIANLTILTPSGALDEVVAFDTGMGNMVLDALVFQKTGGKQRFDEGGKLAKQGCVDERLLAWMEHSDTYLPLPLPKSTGRELYGSQYVATLQTEADKLGVPFVDLLRTTTHFIARSVQRSVERFSPAPLDLLLVGGGGSHNTVLLEALAMELKTEVLTQDQVGRNSDSKEAVAFALLAYEALHGRLNNLVGATGASHRVIMGKIQR
ncbi:MAG: anhydro-N-acetylmuramic acid kinase [Spirochaetales bacterium]|jgi:anhydro-N-acetylmuramic acid kinase|nr:anhydro-N-acetylmuramic acid kinase [Spirochaetales bacterium]